MTAINTNTAALNAQYYLAKSNKDMESSMAKLSSGQKVNSAADDAAGLAIASRMTAQIRGLAMAVKNSNDSMSLAQTAEGAMEEVTNMLQRIRELAVQSANGTMNTSDRASLDAEVQALKAEIDRVANTTQFNSQNLLDGSYKATFQIGDKGGQTVGLKIGSVLTSSLGMGSGAAGANSLVSSRVDFQAVDAGDIEINGQALGAIASTDHMEDVVKNINDNVDNVVASGFNVVVAENVGNGVTGGDGTNGGAGVTSTGANTGMVIKVREQGVTADTTFTISASSSMDELVANINAETGGVVVAATNDDGKLVLSNNTGATISVEDDSTSGSGFAQSVTSFTGFLKLDALDDEPIRVTKGNKGLAAFGTDTDLSRIGFRETKATTLEDGYTILGTVPSSPQTALSQGDLFINGVEIFDEDIVVDSFTDKLALINSKTAETGVTASAFFEKTFNISDDDLSLETFELNGTDITLSNTTVTDLVTKINAQTANTGIEAEANGNNVTLRGENVQKVTIGYKSEQELEGAFNDATTKKTEAEASGEFAVSIVLHADDVVEGRTYKLETTTQGSGATDINVTYTALSGDTKDDIMKGLRDALINFSDIFTTGGTGNVDTSVAGTLTLDAELDYGDGVFAFGVDSSQIRETFGSGSGTTHNGRLKLDSVDNAPIKINLGQNTTDTNHAARHGLIESGVGAADFDVNEPTLSAAGGSSMTGLTITSAASATKALGTIDNAIDTVNSIRGDLGALQNRLEYTINNLSSISNATAGARGRILDADFAKTTSELTKHQILTQAATSMLAQANQSKQGILALLQG